MNYSIESFLNFINEDDDIVKEGILYKFTKEYKNKKELIKKEFDEETKRLYNAWKIEAIGFCKKLLSGPLVKKKVFDIKNNNDNDKVIIDLLDFKIMVGNVGSYNATEDEELNISDKDWKEFRKITNYLNEECKNFNKKSGNEYIRLELFEQNDDFNKDSKNNMYVEFSFFGRETPKRKQEWKQKVKDIKK